MYWRCLLCPLYPLLVKLHLSNFFGKMTEALVISEVLKFPLDDRTDTNFIAPLRKHFQISKSTLDSLKSVFSVFRRKPSLGAPQRNYQVTSGYGYEHSSLMII